MSVSRSRIRNLVPLVAAAGAALSLAACGAPDFEAQFFQVRVMNDLDTNVGLTYCGWHGCSGGSHVPVAAGSSASMSFSDKGVLTVLRVTSDHKVLGCVVREYHARRESQTIALSRMTVCPWR